MRRCILGLVILFAVNALIPAQEPESSEHRPAVGPDGHSPPNGQTVQQEEPASVSGDSPRQNFSPRFKGRPLMLDINARVVEQNQTVVWNETHKKATIPGRPVGIKLVGTNIVVVVQFTPYLRRGMQKFLVAQGQIWMEVPGQGIRYHTSIQTIPLEFGEPIYFFPLGPQTDEDTSRIEVMLTLYPYEEE